MTPDPTLSVLCDMALREKHPTRDDYVPCRLSPTPEHPCVRPRDHEGTHRCPCGRQW